MTVNAADAGSSTLSALARAAGLAVLAIGAAVVLIFTFAAAMIVGLMIAGAALAMRLWPERKAASREDLLEARSTPEGWVVETGARRSKA
jgi:hypothetical protein